MSHFKQFYFMTIHRVKALNQPPSACVRGKLYPRIYLVYSEIIESISSTAMKPADDADCLYIYFFKPSVSNLVYILRIFSSKYKAKWSANTHI